MAEDDGACSITGCGAGEPCAESTLMAFHCDACGADEEASASDAYVCATGMALEDSAADEGPGRLSSCSAVGSAVGRLAWRRRRGIEQTASQGNDSSATST